MKNKYLLVLLAFFMCLICSCDQENTSPISMKQLSDHTIENKLSPLKTSYYETGTVAFGERIPVEYLYRAPQDMVGQRIELSVKQPETSFLYCFQERKNENVQLLILFPSKGLTNANETNYILAEIETDLKRLDQALTESESWNGVITSVHLIHEWDYLYPANMIASNEKDHTSMNADDSVYYGKITLADDGTVGKLCFSCNSMDEISPFKITFERFGVMGA